eukprot:3651196-Prymnesium_polylepis.1
MARLRDAGCGWRAGTAHLRARALDLGERRVHVNRQPDQPRRRRDGARDGEVDPVVRVRDKAALVRRVKLFDGVDEAKGALLDEVLQVDAAVDVPLRHRHHQLQ